MYEVIWDRIFATERYCLLLCMHSLSLQTMHTEFLNAYCSYINGICIARAQLYLAYKLCTLMKLKLNLVYNNMHNIASVNFYSSLINNNSKLSVCLLHEEKLLIA